MKETICVSVGLTGSLIASLFGGWDASMLALILMMAVDYATGLMVAGIFHNSQKTESGALESRAGLKGLCRKGVILLIVLIAAQLDIVLGTTYIRDAACIGFMANELISIVENAGLMGIKIPEKIVKAIEVLQKRSEEDR